MNIFDFEAIYDEPTFDDMWKPTEVFLALRLECKHLYIEGEKFYFCTHPDNRTKYIDWEHCNIENCPLLKNYKEEK